MKKALCVLLGLCMASGAVFAGTLAEDNIEKLKMIAGIFAFRITGGAGDCRACHTAMAVPEKAVAVEDFKDIKGRPVPEGREVAEEFRKQLSANPGIRLAGPEAEVVISGTLLPYKGRQKWRLSIRAVSSTGGVIASYEGLLKRR